MSIEYSDKQYTASLPWKNDHEPLPSNYYVAKGRTESTIRQSTRHTQETGRRYDAVHTS
ncbi:hypothetical protein DPMN_136735 [Dreissena polymorpha]|uniref:Uncharacterized protein n=1 Tax=Dreissena polymorpha TaxID=45954 RepID=A0A9D4G6F9_DREPO|nr:hypothetical protein DPMN_136735 [Dreissena polymorpha]